MNSIKVNAGKILTFWIYKITDACIPEEGLWFIGALGAGREDCHCLNVMLQHSWFIILS